MTLDHNEANRVSAAGLEASRVDAHETLACEAAAQRADARDAFHGEVDAEDGTCANLPKPSLEADSRSSLPPNNSGVHFAAKKRPRFSTVRGAVALAVVTFVVAGLLFRIGSGTPSALGIGQIAAICPLGALEVLAGAKEFMLHPIVLLAVVLVAIVVVGKAFCAWMCPVPWLRKFFTPKKKKVAANDGNEDGKGDEVRDAAAAKGDASDDAAAIGAAEASRAAKAVCATECRDAIHCSNTDSEEIAKQANDLVKSLHAKQADRSAAIHACEGCAAGCALAPVGGARDGVQIDTRHAVLAGTLASAAVFGFPVFCLICPVGLTFATLIGVWNLFRFNEPSWALIVFPAILIFEVVFLRKWCSKICPVSALVSLVSNANVTLKPRVDRERCLRERGIDCHACVDACPEQLDPHIGRIPECSKCGKCVEACPAHAISIKLK